MGEDVSYDNLIRPPDGAGAPIFKNRGELEDFCVRFYEKVGPDLRKQAEARRRSEEQARYHMVD